MLNRNKGDGTQALIYASLAKTKIGFEKADAVAEATKRLWAAVCDTGVVGTLERTELASAVTGKLVAGLALAVADLKNKNQSGDDCAEVADEIINRINFWAFEYLILHLKAEAHKAKSQEKKDV